MKTARKILILAVAAGVTALAGCDKRPPQTVADAAPANSAAPAKPAEPIPGQQPVQAALHVPADKVVPFDNVRRENGVWTEKGCTLTLDEDKPEMTLASTDSHTFEGFFVSYESGSPGDFLFVLLGPNHSFAVPATTNVARPDVRDYFKSEAALNAGYRFTAELSKVPAGEYMVDLFYPRDGKDYFCETGKKLIIK